MTNPKVFMDIEIHGAPAGRIVFELSADITPKTVENFRALCTGEKGRGKSGKPLHYKGLTFDECSMGQYIFASGNEESIYGPSFELENFDKKHVGPGLLATANSGPKTSSRFYITTSSVGHTEGICVGFGEVIEGMNVVYAIENLGNGPITGVVIVDCGELIEDRDDDDDDDDEDDEEEDAFVASDDDDDEDEDDDDEEDVVVASDDEDDDNDDDEDEDDDDDDEENVVVASDDKVDDDDDDEEDVVVASDDEVEPY